MRAIHRGPAPLTVRIQTTASALERLVWPCHVMQVAQRAITHLTEATARAVPANFLVTLVAKRHSKVRTAGTQAW